MTFQVFSPSVSSLANGIGAIGTPTRAVDAICPVLTWSHSVVSVSADVFTIPQGYKAVLLHGLYMEPDNVGSNLVIQTRWYSENASAYIGCATNATALTSGGTTLIRAPCAIAMIDASNESVNVTLRASYWSRTDLALKFVGTRVDYLGDSWVSIMTVRA